jgi:tRNA A-37 threonylcarbamoyl transferase component Bud32
MTSHARRRIAPGRRLFGRYQIERRIGRGGSAEVWLAHDDRLDRTVAIKAPLPDALPDAAARDRFEAEARAAAGLSHPAIVPVYDVVRDGSTQAMVLRYVDGETLATRIARDGRMQPGEAARIGADLAGALAHAHAAGLVHRDVKPGNVLVDADGRAQLVDFGIAGSLVDPPVEDRAVREVTGTLRYMAPEQLRGRPADARSDLYALGLVLYELLAGRPAFDPATPAELVSAQADGPAALPGSVPPALRGLVTRLLAVDPRDRPGSATEVEAALRRDAALAGDDEARAAAAIPPTVAAGLPAALAGFGIAASAAQGATPDAPLDDAPLDDAPLDDAPLETADPGERPRLGAGTADDAATMALPIPATAAVAVPGPERQVAAADAAPGVVGIPARPQPRSGQRPASRRPFLQAALAGLLIVGGLILGAAISGLDNQPAAADGTLQAIAGETASPSPTRRATPAPKVEPVVKGPPVKHHKGHGRGH